MKTLPDYLREGLDIVSIGLNPSLFSVDAGYYFARPQNRFWKAFIASELVPEALVPSKDAVEKLFQDYRIGFTDVVKRPSAGAAQLKTQDFREWAPLLRDKLLACRPLIAWFHGKLAYRNYLLYAEAIEINFSWGEQERHLGGSRVFVSPNPSSANAAISLQEIMASYQALKALRDRLRAQ